eukprot:TRINITY_DN28996_c0_g1_i1.p1 TRINITY_DN28996_c0_g1~~TRINITY_DN28996_c0_g1_i1.p1  ORF type:complete len:392 (-),score=49.06 TRINITY_DN28996_c0_g1_i1:189-1364(-)
MSRSKHTSLLVLLRRLATNQSPFNAGRSRPSFFRNSPSPASRFLCVLNFHCFSKAASSFPLSRSPLSTQAEVEAADGDSVWNSITGVAQAQEQGATFIAVKTYFLGTSVDLKGLQAECFKYGSVFDVVPPSSRSSNYIILKSPANLHDYSPSRNDGMGTLSEPSSKNRYMVVFQYGSVVLFNIRDQGDEEQQCLQLCRKYASGLISEIRKDDYGILEKPSLDKWMQDGPDYIVLKRFDIDCIRIIGSVLGQSIALDHFVRQVDLMVAEFTELNRGMEKTGTFTMKRQKLFQLVGKANSNLADVILKLGLFERSDVAWKNAKYAQIWEYLRDEFELTQRFGNLDYKLKFVEHNVRYFLEILQNRKSDFLEWLIIILISGEMMIAMYDVIRHI